MSRLAKKPIQIPEKTEIKWADGIFEVKGPLGTLSKKFKDDVSISIDNSEIVLKVAKESLFSKALIGTYASHITNMIEGVHKPYEKKLILEGVGFKAEVQGKEVVLSLGFSHPVRVSIPEGINVSIEKGDISISGIDKDKVGEFTASLRALKKPEPYKGKGMRYADEVIRRKQGKKAV